MFKKTLIYTVVALAFIAVSHCHAQTPEFRAIWVDSWSPGFKSSTECDQLLANARYCNANAIIVQMRRRGDTYYPSSYEPFALDANPSFDALAYLIQKAHNISPRIEVHVWFVTLPVATSSVPTDERHPFVKYPEYLSKDDSGNTYGYENYWFDPGHPGAEEYLYNVFMDVVNRYDVDGIHFDYIRFGGNRWGYNDVSVSRFNKAYGRTGLPAYNDTNWSNWRRAQVTNLVRKVYANAIAVKPNIKVSASTIPWGSAPTYEDGWYSTSAYSSVFQDWRAWMAEGILDLNIPMVYADCGSLTRLTNWKNWTADHMYNRAAAVGLSSCTAWSCLPGQVGIVRNPSPGGKSVSGMSMYCYDCGHLSDIKSVWPTWAPTPVMSWKASPTKGHIKGSVTVGGAWIDGATVSITGPVNRTMTADGTGFYAFIDLPPGAYNVTASKAGYGSVSLPGVVTAGQVTTVDLLFPVPNLVISNIQVTNETSSSVTITWNTNAGATSQVAYGTDKSCSNLTTEDTSLVMSHSVTVTGLQPLTGYYFKVLSGNPETQPVTSPVYAFVTGPLKPDIIIDNDSPNTTISGSWSTGTGAGRYGANYRYCTTNLSVGDKSATYRPNIPVAGNYRVSVWYVQGANRTTDARYTIYYNGGNQTYSVNQEINGSQWNMLGTKPFAVGTSGYVQLTNLSSVQDQVIADAVRLEYVPTDTTPPSVPTNLQKQVISHQQINLTWNISTDSVGVSGYRIHRDGAVIGFSYTNSYSDTGLIPNKQYTYSVSAYDTAGNKSGTSTTVSAYTLSLPPTPTTITCSKQAGVWHTSNPFTFTSTGGFGVGGVAYYSYSWDTSPVHTWDGSEWTWAASNLVLNAVSGPNPYYLHLKGYNALGIANGTIDLGPYYLDETAPAAPVVTDEGLYTPASGLSVSVDAQDNESGISEIKYAIGTTPGGTDIADWTTTSPNGPITYSGLSSGTSCFVSVQAKNGAGVWSPTGSSDGITAATSVDTISALRSYTSGAAVILSGKVISANFSSSVYAQEPDRSAGVKIEASSSASVGDRASIAGIWTVADGVGTLSSGEVKVTGTGPVPAAVGMSSASVGGSDVSSSILGIPGSTGPYNIGLLIRTWGKVTSVGTGFFTISDGSGASVKVYSSVPVVYGQTVGVTGISFFETNGTDRIRVILTRDASDVRVYQ